MVIQQTQQIISLKEARKLLGAEYKNITDSQVSFIVECLRVIVAEYIDYTVPFSKIHI